MSDSRRNKLSKPSRTIGWSSTSTTRMGISVVSPVGGELDAESRTGRGGTDRQRAAERPHPLFQHHRAELQSTECHVVVLAVEREAAAVIGHDDVNLAVRSRDLYTHLGGAGMARGVHDRPVHDPTDIVPPRLPRH